MGYAKRKTDKCQIASTGSTANTNIITNKPHPNKLATFSANGNLWDGRIDESISNDNRSISRSHSHLVSGEQVQRRAGHVDDHVLLNPGTSFHGDVIELRPGTIR